MQAKLYPWQANDYGYLLQLKQRLPHAILLHGPSGLGVLELARSWIQSLLCLEPNPDGSYCSHCRSCVLLSDDAHPDFLSLRLSPEDEKKSITIADVRTVIDFLALSAHLGKYKIILIEDTNSLNPNSANALLKILEEPASYAIFVLVSNNLNDVIPTIISRCHKYKSSIPNIEAASKFLAQKDVSNASFWLKYYNYCPLFEIVIDEEQLNRLLLTLAKPSIDNLFNLSSEFDGKTVSFGFILEFLSKWTSDLLSRKVCGKYNYFSEYADMLEPLIAKLQLEKGFYFHDRVNFLTNWSAHPLNYKLQIENLLFHYQQIFVK